MDTGVSESIIDTVRVYKSRIRIFELLAIGKVQNIPDLDMTAVDQRW